MVWRCYLGSSPRAPLVRALVVSWSSRVAPDGCLSSLSSLSHSLFPFLFGPVAPCALNLPSELGHRLLHDEPQCPSSHRRVEQRHEPCRNSRDNGSPGVYQLFHCNLRPPLTQFCFHFLFSSFVRRPITQALRLLSAATRLEFRRKPSMV